MTLDRLVVFLEHLAEVASLLQAGGVARHRMALVAADQLAEMLLQDHLEQTLAVSEELGPLSPQRWDLARRQQLSRDFPARVELARLPRIDWPSAEPWLDTHDATVFRVAHGYRNALYHSGRHNARLGRSLAVVYAQAVGRTLVRSWSLGITIGVSARDTRLRALRRLGASTARSPFEPRTLAAECVRHLVGGFRVQRKSLCKQLVLDLKQRAHLVETLLDDLTQRGVSREMQRDLVRAALLWAAYRADPEIVRLQDAQGAILAGVSARGGVLDDEAVEYAANEVALRQRRDDLGRRFRPPVSVATARAMGRSAQKLGSAPDTATLLERYQRLDERLELLERAVTVVDIDLERAAERESDLTRGK